MLEYSEDAAADLQDVGWTPQCQHFGLLGKLWGKCGDEMTSHSIELLGESSLQFQSHMGMSHINIWALQLYTQALHVCQNSLSCYQFHDERKVQHRQERRLGIQL